MRDVNIVPFHNTALNKFDWIYLKTRALDLEFSGIVAPITAVLTNTRWERTAILLD